MAENGQALIKLDGVTKVFFTDEVETHALSGIHLLINKGEYVSIAGPSGCGKSTLLSILGLLDSPTEGQYLLNNRPVAELAASERARVRNREIGFIFQSFKDRKSTRLNSSHDQISYAVFCLKKKKMIWSLAGSRNQIVPTRYAACN